MPDAFDQVPDGLHAVKSLTQKTAVGGRSPLWRQWWGASWVLWLPGRVSLLAWLECSVEWREIEIFLTLAEELHFGRTAERSHVSQARVTQTIQALERRIGGRLFERTSRSVRLTSLGERFRDELRPGYQQLLRAFESARESAQGITGDLRISVMSLMVGGPWFGQIIRRFEDAHPLCRIQVSEADTNTGLGRARNGDVDVVAAYLPLAQDDLTIGPVLSRRDRVLLVAADHPLATREYVTVEDLADVAVIVPAGLPPETRDTFSPSRTPGGRAIQRTPVGPIVAGASLLSMVASGRYCYTTIAGVREAYGFPGLTELPLRDLPPLESAIVWVTSRETAAIRGLAKYADEITSGDAADPSTQR
jgi:DNA-binding transcriptional LysR family regulator